MKKGEFFGNYPLWMVFVSNILSLGIYLIGAIIIYQIGVLWMVLYLIFIAVLEFRLVKGHCVDCYYYGKTCAFGKGKVCAMFFKKGNVKNFCRGGLTWKDLVPEFLVSLIPVVIGIVFLILRFNWILLIGVLVLIFLTFMGNALVRRNMACKYCKQRKIGCPAEKLFDSRRMSN